MSCNTLVVSFPDDLGCIDVGKYTCKVPRKTSYVGGSRRLVDKKTVEGVWKVFDSQTREKLLLWWENDLMYGNNHFRMPIKFFGIVMDLELRFIQDLSEVMKDVGYEIPIILEIVEASEANIVAPNDRLEFTDAFTLAFKI